jgi:short-subunit dehydrogenase
MTATLLTPSGRGQTGHGVLIASMGGSIGIDGFSYYASSIFTARGFVESLRTGLSRLGISLYFLKGMLQM